MDNYYVYIYLDPRKSGNFEYKDLKFEYEPFYVGKGRLSRYLRHMRKDYLDNSIELKNNPLKINKISKILKDGFQPIIIKYKENLTNEISLKLEKEIIEKIGRIIKKNGPLVNFRDGGEESIIGYKQDQSFIDKLYKPVIKYTLDGRIVDRYKSVGEAGEKNNVPPQTISNVLNGSIKIFKNKFIFLYENEGDRFQTNGYLWRYKSHPKLEEFNEKIYKKYSKYLNLLNRKIISLNTKKVYNNLLHVIKEFPNIKCGNLLHLLKSEKIYKFI